MDGRKDGQTLFYRTLSATAAGPKSIFKGFQLSEIVWDLRVDLQISLAEDIFDHNLRTRFFS